MSKRIGPHAVMTNLRENIDRMNSPASARRQARAVFDKYFLNYYGLERLKNPTSRVKFKLMDNTQLVLSRESDDYKSGKSITFHSARTLVSRTRKEIELLNIPHHAIEYSLKVARNSLLKIGIAKTTVEQFNFKAGDNISKLNSLIVLFAKQSKSATDPFAAERYVKIREVISKIKIYPEIYYMLGDLQYFLSTITAPHSKLVKELKNTAPLKMNDTFFLCKAREILSNVDSLNNDENKVPDLILALMTVTGRRSIEILKLSQFSEPVGDEERAGYCHIDIFAKSKTRELNEDLTKFNIPLLHDLSSVQRGLNALREAMYKEELIKKSHLGYAPVKYDDGTGNIVTTFSKTKKYFSCSRHNKAVGNLYNNRINIRLRDWTGSPNISSKALRGLYVAIVDAHETQLGQHDDRYIETPNNRAARILCYATNNENNAIENYQRVQISRDIKTAEVPNFAEVIGKNSGRDMQEEKAVKLELLSLKDKVIEEFSVKKKNLALIHETYKSVVASGGDYDVMDANKVRSFMRASGGKTVGKDLAIEYLILIGLIKDKIEGATSIYYPLSGVWYRQSKLDTQKPPQVFCQV